MTTFTYGTNITFGTSNPSHTPSAGQDILFQNQTNNTLWVWDTQAWKQISPVSVSNGILGTGTVADPFKLGGTLTENIVFNGATLYNIQFTDIRNFTATVNNGASASRVTFSLATPLSTGSYLRSELYTDANVYGQMVVDTDGPGTELGQYNGANFARLKFPSSSALDLELLNGSTAYAYRIDTGGFKLTNLPDGSYTHTITVNPVDGTLGKKPITLATPTVATNAAAGTGATATIAGDGNSFIVTLNTGTSTNLGTLFTVTLPYTLSSVNKGVVFSPHTANAPALDGYISNITTTTVAFGGAATPSASTTYKIGFTVL